MGILNPNFTLLHYVIQQKQKSDKLYIRNNLMLLVWFSLKVYILNSINANIIHDLNLQGSGVKEILCNVILMFSSYCGNLLLGAGLSHWAAAEQGNIVQTLIQFSCRSQDKWETVFMDNDG